MSIRRRYLSPAKNDERRITRSPPRALHALPIRAEPTGSDTATALGISARSNSPILTLCRLLINAGHNASAHLEAHRGSTLFLSVYSIGGAARATVKEPNGRFAKLHLERRFRP
jgi:hypothetical protein